MVGTITFSFTVKQYHLLKLSKEVEEALIVLKLLHYKFIKGLISVSQKKSTLEVLDSLMGCDLGNICVKAER
jgi:hypothetical protein